MEIGEHYQIGAESCCSKCGRPLQSREKAGLTVEIGWMNSNGQSVRISSREYQIVKKLLQLYPDLVLHDDMYLAVWGYDSDVQDKTKHVYMCKLRKKLRPLGFDIKLNFGIGYRLAKYVAR